MKTLLTTDWHLDAVTAGVMRLREFDAYLDRVVEAAESTRVEVIGVLGDIFDPGRMNGPELTTRMFWAAERLATVRGVRKVLWVAGNHDVVESSDGFTTLSPLAAAVRGGFLSSGESRTYVWEKPEVRDFGSYAVLGLPYRARLATNANPGELDAALGEAKRLASEAPLIVLGHMTVPGAVLGSESAEMARGRDLDIPLTALADLNPVLVANGHYHKAQTVKGPGGVRVVIPGSPHRFTFGERDDADKGFVIVDIPGVHA